ncbi:ABC transporter ATP-binding protein [Paenibacillus sp. WLX2291]|uniref:ABC transporter ATP-binding protein n=1 Tax=Paenibacillus sp. WLX2291 TaxID=3296934 RepID=UPI003983E89E
MSNLFTNALFGMSSLSSFSSKPKVSESTIWATTQKSVAGHSAITPTSKITSTAISTSISTSTSTSISASSNVFHSTDSSLAPTDPVSSSSSSVVDSASLPASMVLTDTPEISLKDVEMRYRTGTNEVLALHQVSLDIAKGEFVSLLGPSGCGKTTLLRLMADLLEPTSGELTVAGNSAREARLARKYGIVFQSPVLYDWRKVKHNVALPLEMMNVPRKEREEKVMELLELVGLGKFADKYPWQLSGGMQQRAAIARALAMEPEILLMDEPFSALDEFSRERLNEELLSIWNKVQNTIVFVTHSIPESVFLSDRVFVLSPHPGRLSAVVDIPLPRPRTAEMRNSPEFFELIANIRNSFEGV